MITFNTLDEALLSGVIVTHANRNGNYVEYFTYENDVYFIRRWVFGMGCITMASFTNINEVLAYKKKCNMEDFHKGIIRAYYSFNTLQEKLKAMVDIKTEDETACSMFFAQEIDDTHYFRLAITKYPDATYDYEIKLRKIRRFSDGPSDKPVFERYAVDDEHYLKLCDEFIKTLEDLNLQGDWYRTARVKIKNEVEA